MYVCMYIYIYIYTYPSRSQQRVGSVRCTCQSYISKGIGSFV